MQGIGWISVGGRWRRRECRISLGKDVQE